MTGIFLNQYGHFNDSLERDLMLRSLGNGETVSITAALKSIASGLKKVVWATARYIKEVNRALNEARARDAKMCGAQW
ncbi:hypothetical protein H0A58_06830 [Alcaligenaceae bacterium]|nr:hypothetical protein [Alcaligenaceae bacterium]